MTPFGCSASIKHSGRAYTYPKCWDEPYTPPDSLKEPMRSAMVAAGEKTRRLTPEQKQAMYDAQRESFIRAMAPCEHGDPDWETCPECRKGAP